MHFFLPLSGKRLFLHPLLLGILCVLAYDVSQRCSLILVFLIHKLLLLRNFSLLFARICLALILERLRTGHSLFVIPELLIVALMTFNRNI